MTSYRHSYGSRKSTPAPSGNTPTPKQLSYLAALVSHAGLTQEEWRESVGLYESSPWGNRLRTEMITRAAVSRWIDALKSRSA